jgi:anti-anti-sigma factor
VSLAAPSGADDVEVQRVGHICLIRPRGRFDYNLYGTFNAAVQQGLTMDGVSEFQVDLDEVVYLDSSAIGMLIKFQADARPLGGSLTLLHARGVVREILEIANIQAIITLR